MREYGDEVEFVGMAGRAGTSDMQAFVDEFGLEFPHAVSEDGTLWARFGVPYQPAWVFVTPSGEVTVHQGPYQQAELEQVLDELSGG